MTVKMKKYTIAQYEQRISDIREAVLHYIRTEGCGCGRLAGHEEFEELLGELLEVPRYSDDSGYNWWSE